MTSSGIDRLILQSLPGGLLVADLAGSVQFANKSALRILEIESSSPDSLADFLTKRPNLRDILGRTAQSLLEINRQEINTTNGRGENVVLGYGTLVFRDSSGKPAGVGLLFQDITKFVPVPLTARYISLANRFFMPYAICMVGAAVVFGAAEPWEKRLASLVLILTLVFNTVTGMKAQRSQDEAHWLARWHTPANFIAMGLLVYYLGTFWGPMWLLVALTPIATALYAGRVKTVFIGVTSALFLLAIYEHRGLEGSVGWAQAGLHALFIVFLSLFINALSGVVSKARSGR